MRFVKVLKDFNLNKFPEVDEPGQHRAPRQGFSNDDDDFYHSDVV